MAQGCSRTLLLDIQSLRNTYRGLKDDLAFDVVRPGFMHASSFTVWSYVFFRGWKISVQKTMVRIKFYSMF